MKSKHLFGLWGEGCVDRALRDSGRQVLSLASDNFRRTYDREVINGETRTLVQIKSTEKYFGDGLDGGTRFHYVAVARWLEEVADYKSVQLARGTMPHSSAWVVVCLDKSAIAVYSEAAMRCWCAELEERNGDRSSVPGVHLLPWYKAFLHFALRRDEVLEGIRLCKDGDDAEDQQMAIAGF